MDFWTPEQTDFSMNSKTDKQNLSTDAETNIH